MEVGSELSDGLGLQAQQTYRSKWLLFDSRI